MRVVLLKACTLLCWLLLLNAVTPAFSNKNNIRTRESDRKLEDVAKDAAEGSSQEAAELVASVEGIVHEMKTQPAKRAEELGLEGELIKFASEVKTKEIARFEKEATSPKTTNVKQLAENFHAEANETDKQILQMIGQKQAQLADELGTMAKGIEVVETLVRTRAAEDADLEAKTEKTLSDADHLVFDFKRQQKALKKKFSAPVCCAVDVDEAEPSPLRLKKLTEVIASALQIEMNRLALQHGFDILVNGTSGIEIVPSLDSRRRLEEGQNNGTLVKFTVEQQLSCSTDCKPHNIYHDEGRFLLLQNKKIQKIMKKLQKTMKKRVQEYMQYELEDKSEVDCTPCGAWNWETSDFSSHVSPEDYEDVQEFIHAKSLLLEQEFQRDTELNERIAHCDYQLPAKQQKIEDHYLSCVASVNAWIAEKETSTDLKRRQETRMRRRCRLQITNGWLYARERKKYDKCVDKANFIYKSTQSSLINTYKDLEHEVSEGAIKIISSVSSMMMNEFNQLVDHAKNKQAELREVLLTMAQFVEETIVCDISGTIDEIPSIEDVELMSTLFEFSLNSAYRKAGLNKRMDNFSFYDYESCQLNAETLECDESNRQLHRTSYRNRINAMIRRFSGRGNNYRASAANAKKLWSNRRSLTSIKEDPTHDAMELKRKHVEVHRRVNTIDENTVDEDFFVQHVNSQFGELYMRMFDDTIEDKSEFSVHCSLNTGTQTPTISAPTQSMSDHCDWGCYLDRYADLKQIFVDDQSKAQSHFIKYGKREGRDCTCCVWACYLNRYPDLQAAFGSDKKLARRHYAHHGYNEGRDCSCDV
eukprot:CAMPEP_0198302968 /NCGR_PEP_ID=MMETSP1449-20131203/56645_1 /TAXON_ID=420275 /ORGANISM="Attheya septentrionalis, Strain CCMP2084" /LENGTH=815 /DNA_ID=CAMNT_0044005447 /DNA_START=234 /DNA_END=2681 /DNA_ORIENTATION=+